MRDILFRGKCVDNGELVVGNLIKTGSKTKHGDDGIFSESYISNVEDLNIITHLSRHKISTKMTVIQVFDETVSQYTGLKDKNGKMIFEGDIVSVYSDHDQLLREHEPVFFEEGCFYHQCVTMAFSFCNKKSCNFEITGTIHDK